MAKRRMFSSAIVMSDAFLDMPASSRALYFVLCMIADDDGVVGAPKSAIRMSGASTDDLQVLLAKCFVLQVGCVVIIKHWRMSNTLRKDTYKPTTYQEELATVRLKRDGSYTLKPGPETIEDAVENLLKTEPMFA